MSQKKNKQEVAIAEDILPDLEGAVWFQKLVGKAREAMDEYNTAKGELSFQLRWHEIEAKHKIGQLLEDNRDRVAKFEELVRLVGHEVGLSRTVLFQCVEVVKMYPKLDMIPDGKNIGWSKLLKVYVAGKADPAGCKHGDYKMVTYKICGKCGKHEVVHDGDKD